MKGIRGRFTAVAIATVVAVSPAVAGTQAALAADRSPAVPTTPAAAKAAAQAAARDLPGVCGPPYVGDHSELGPASDWLARQT